MCLTKLTVGSKIVPAHSCTDTSLHLARLIPNHETVPSQSQVASNGQRFLFSTISDRWIMHTASPSPAMTGESI